MILLVSDPHFTDKPEDSYRFDLFSMIDKWDSIHNLDAIVILGDLTELKDNHSANLVNKIVSNLCKIASIPVYILMGNHDYLDPENPFFNFLNKIDNITFIIEPTIINIEGNDCVFIPHSKDFNAKTYAKQFAHYEDDHYYDYIFIHQCVDGAIAETGKRLTGTDTKPLKALRAEGGIWAGDIHKPQRVGNVHYVGAPYNIRFGDNFEGRCILLDTEHFLYEELKFDTPRKWSLTIRDADELLSMKNIKMDDFVKITLQLSKEEVPDWANQKDNIITFCIDRGLQLTGPELQVMKSSKRRKIKSKEQSSNEPRDVLKGFCKYEKVPNEVKEAGLEIIKDV